MKPRLGLAYIPTMAPEALPDIARAADEAGLDDLWVWEDCFSQSGIAAATAALSVTSRLRVGIGLMPVPLRNVALSAMEIALIDRMFPGRFVPGIGHGVQDWMGQAGVRTNTPLTLLREYEDALRHLLAGETVTTSGKFVNLENVALDWPPLGEVPLMAGGTGPRTLDFAGSLAHGTLLPNAFTDDEIVAACERIHAAHAAGEHAGRDHEIVYLQIAATGDGAAARLAADVAGWREGPTDGIGIAGSAAEIAASVDHLVSLGVTTIVIEPTKDEPDLLPFIHFLGAEVRPLLTS